MKAHEYMLQALKEAVQMELDGHEFYQQAAKQVQNPGVRQILEYLAESETYHIKRLQEIYAGFQKDPNWTASMAEFQPPPAQPNICVLAMNQAGDEVGGRDDLQALKTGIKMEECSIDYYTKLARESYHPLARRFFLSIVHEERGHYLDLMDMHNYLSDPADWFYVKQMGHVDGQ